MGDLLSQDEINALLKGSSESTPSSNENVDLSPQEIDALGEIGNISMGTSANTLSNLLGQNVSITIPKVVVSFWDDLNKQYLEKFVGIKIEYTCGLTGTNLLILKENDVKLITDLMMGGDGANTSGDITDLHLSAISEAMNQMVSSSITSLSSMFGKRIEISPPKSNSFSFADEEDFSGLKSAKSLVKIVFNFKIGESVDSEIIQLIPIPFAKDLVNNLLNSENTKKQQSENNEKSASSSAANNKISSNNSNTEHKGFVGSGTSNIEEQNVERYNNNAQNNQYKNAVNVQPVQFQSFDDSKIMVEKKNIGLIMDVPLQVTVELGRTNKLIGDILEFGPGSIIELDKLAGEPVDILVNGKIIAKGEVVVIDESFGVRITDIIHPSKRL